VRVQRFLLPPETIEGDGWRIEHLYRPVDRLCGDFIDVHERPDGRVAILVADVCGHGTSAALTTAMAKTAFQRAAPDAKSPAELLTEIQAELVGMTPPDRFLSALAALFDPSGGSIDLASAGHPYPLLINDSGVEVIRQNNGMLLLIAPEKPYSNCHRLALKPGDRLLAYTDGAIEVADRNGEMLDMTGLSRLADQAARTEGEPFLQSLFGQVSAYAGNGLQDDVALLSVTVA
jgi:sigma-B regulation protein RsbU (phosphoserine phosphatase)